MSAELVTISEKVAGFLDAAVKAYGLAVLTVEEGADGGPEAQFGRRLIREVFGGQSLAGSLHSALTEPVAFPEDDDAFSRLFDWVSEVLEDDPALEASTAEMLHVYYRRQFAAGKAMAMSDLGDLLLSEDQPQQARAAYRQATDAGYAPALVALAELQHNDRHDPDGAKAACQEAIDSTDPDVSAHGLALLGFMLERHHHEYGCAIQAYERAIETGHPHWAMAGWHGLAFVRRQQGDLDGARAAYQQIIDSGDADWAAQGLVGIGALLESAGDAVGAKSAYWQLLDSPAMSSNPSGPVAQALVNLVNVLQRENDVDALWAAYRKAAASGNRYSSHALVAIGRLLQAEGDVEGARAAWQRAVDSGYEHPEDLWRLIEQ